MTDFQQYQLGQTLKNNNQTTPVIPSGQDFNSSSNVLQTNKSLIVGAGQGQVILSPNKGFASNIVALNMDTITYAATITLDITLGGLHKTTTTSAVGNATINANSGGVNGQIIYILITNDSSAPRTITFGTNFKPSATIVGTASKSATIQFISDGTNFYEVSRTLVL